MFNKVVEFVKSVRGYVGNLKLQQDEELNKKETRKMYLHLLTALGHSSKIMLGVSNSTSAIKVVNNLLSDKDIYYYIVNDVLDELDAGSVDNTNTITNAIVNETIEDNGISITIHTRVQGERIVTLLDTPCAWQPNDSVCNNYARIAKWVYTIAQYAGTLTSNNKVSNMRTIVLDTDTVYVWKYTLAYDDYRIAKGWNEEELGMYILKLMTV